ncbi:MAG: M23 family metallopeptidase [Bdellovibrionaceae bacterium]|nr:M23 family metallopeptidase [Pseudobdellovibrionaceae bacterium]
MKKLKLIASLFIIVSLVACSSEPVHNNNNHDEGPVFQVNKEQNSIKKTDPNHQAKNKHKKPFFDWPVWEARMSRGFMPRVKRKGRRASRPHKGIDLAAQRGVPVMASTDGVVIYTGKDFNGFGKMIMIETVGDNTGYATLYAHLDKIVVYDGQKVTQGEVIGALGNTGRSSGPHLHFEIRKSDGIPVDPLPYLPAGKDLTNDVDDPSAPEE